MPTLRADCSDHSYLLAWGDFRRVFLYEDRYREQLARVCQRCSVGATLLTDNGIALVFGDYE